MNSIDGVMYRARFDCGRSWVKPKTVELVLAASGLSTEALRRNSQEWLARNRHKVERHIYPRTIFSVGEHYKYHHLIKIMSPLRAKADILF
jgi:hypothetical protein